jgi:putative FmdB family regulatory protein
MPIYTYRCENCGLQFERQQKFTDQPLTRCPECNKKSLHKVYTPVGIIFKGSGFYATDHRSPSGQGRAEKGKNGEGEKKSETSSSESSSTSSEKSSASSSEEKK